GESLSRGIKVDDDVHVNLGNCRTQRLLWMLCLCGRCYTQLIVLYNLYFYLFCCVNFFNLF
ncbi:hypothetical protein CICLE_v10003714mg, partial [Citrus x clementina]